MFGVVRVLLRVWVDWVWVGSTAVCLVGLE